MLPAPTSSEESNPKHGAADAGLEAEAAPATDGKHEDDDGYVIPPDDEGHPIRGLSSQQLAETIAFWADRWTNFSRDPTARRREMMELFGLTDPLLPGDVTSKHKRWVEDIVTMNSEAMSRHLTGNATPAHMTLTNNLIELKRRVMIVYHILLGDACATEPAGHASTDVASGLGLSFEHLNSGVELKPFQQLTLYLLNRCDQCRYRKLGDDLYQEIKSATGHGTHCWEKVMTIQNFVITETGKDTRFELWQMRTESNRDLVDPLTRYLTTTVIDPEIPELKPDQFWVSWANGMYHIASNSFFEYGHPDVPRDVVSRKLFKGNFDVAAFEAAKASGDYLGIPTPAFQRVLDTQRLGKDYVFEDREGCKWWWHPDESYYLLSKEVVASAPDGSGVVTRLEFVKENDATTKFVVDSAEEMEARGWKAETTAQAAMVLMAMMGRMQYPLHMEDGKTPRDNWQMLPFVIGPAGNGKSTIGNIVAGWFKRIEVGVLNSNCEEKWALSGIYDKRVWMCYEVRQNFKLDTASFQSVVSGEPTVVNVKNVTPFDIEWDAPGALFGNEMPAMWHDGSGSLLRRILLFNFAEVPRHMDPGLFARIEQEMSMLMVKCNCLYMQLLTRCRSQGKVLRDILGPYFRSTARYLSRNVHSLIRFLDESAAVELGPQDSVYMPMEDLQRQYYEFCKDNKIGSKSWNPEFYQTPFKARKLRVQKAELPWPPGTSVSRSGTWVMGIRVVEHRGGYEDGELSTASLELPIPK